MQTSNNATVGIAVLKNFDVYTERNWFWIGAAALLGFTVLFNVLFTLALMYLNRKNQHSVQFIFSMILCYFIFFNWLTNFMYFFENISTWKTTSHNS